MFIRIAVSAREHEIKTQDAPEGIAIEELTTETEGMYAEMQGDKAASTAVERAITKLRVKVNQRDGGRKRDE